ncbi:MAG: hypothetical protein EA384_02395 [Spirochaetaceae bacterium]|nr:MAG: hypothetical protein EA384_02395 [Spirochaetaceae bacterium]
MAKTRAKKRSGSIGILFWVAFILLILVVFVYNRPTIERTLENTGLVEALRERFQRGDPDSTEPTPAAPREPDIAIELEPADPEPIEPAPQPRREPPQQPAPAAEPSEPRQPPVEAPPAPPAPGVPTQRTRVSKLYFIRVTDDGRIFPEQVDRTVAYTNNPMTQTLHALIAGPTIDELNAGLLNLMPENTRLISAAIRDETAYLNFNEAFRFNPMGVEGLVAQLQQVVFSTTEFGTIRRVQILIEGQRVQYLGGDGVYIGEPLDRSSFG